MQGNNILLKDLVEDSLKLVFRYSSLNCSLCIDSQLVYLKKFITQYGKEKLIILASYNHPKEVYQFKLLNKIENEVYNVKRFDTLLSNLNVPYYFILDKTMRPKMIFIPDKLFYEDTKKFFTKLDAFF